MAELKGKVAIVTGGGRNLGEAIAKAFAREGAAVCIVDRDEARGAKVRDDLVMSGARAMSVVADVSKPDDVEAMVDQVVTSLGCPDILVNNVAISDNKHIFDLSFEEWSKVIAVTLGAPYVVTKAVASRMVKEGKTGGSVVNIGSTSGHRGRANALAYTAAKSGIVNLTKSLAIQLAPYGIRVNSVSPNRVGSPVGKDDFDPERKVLNLLGRAGRVEETAEVVLFLVTDKASFIVGENIFVDGGVMAKGG